MTFDPWKIILFNGLCATRAGNIVETFETRKTTALFACLALFPTRAHSREVLAEQLWPDEDPVATRNRLRQALSTLRHVLEPEGTPVGSFLISGRNEVRINTENIITDTGEFDAALASARRAENVHDRIEALRRAADLYTGDILPGFYEEWIVAERNRLTAAYQSTLCQLAMALAQSGDYPAAIAYARQAVLRDPLSEETHCELMRVFQMAGRRVDALRQYRELERLLRDELGETPSSAARKILDTAEFSVPTALVTSNEMPAALPGSSGTRHETEGGAVPLQSPYYVVRPTDEHFQDAIARQDSIVLVKGARQIGKTSLLARGLQQAREAGASVVLTDLQKLGTEQMASADTLFRTFAEMILDQLDLDISLEEVWNPKRGWNVNFERFMRREVLLSLDRPVVWGLDEIDRLFGHPFSDAVFGLFRSWHNERSLNPDGPWGRLTLAIAYATEAHLFISDLNQSPFNVGTRLTLEDFTPGEVGKLNRSYGSPLKEAELAIFYRLLGGHPYLVRRALHCMLNDRLTLAEIELNAHREDGLFGDHLRRMLGSLTQDTLLCDAVRSVLKGQGCPTQESFYRLRSAGVIVGEASAEAQPRCGLYRKYLSGRLT